MEEVDISLIVGILITMVFSAFFSGMENSLRFLQPYVGGDG